MLALFSLSTIFYAISVTGAGVDIVNLISPGNGLWTNGTNDTIQFRFNYTGGDSPATCVLFIDNTSSGTAGPVANGSTGTVYANHSLSDGIFNWFVNCTNANSMISGTWALFIDNEPPSVNLLYPPDNHNSSNQSMGFKFTALDNMKATMSCALYINGSFSGENVSVTNATNTTIQNTSVPNGSSTWYIECSDAVSNGNSVVRNINVNMTTPDETPPSLLNITEDAVSAISANIIWETDEPSDSTVSHFPFSHSVSGSVNSASLTMAHNLTLKYLTKNTTHYYNVTSCDASGNCNISGVLNFTTLECNSSWACGDWSSCTGGQKTRSCNDGSMCQYPWVSEETQSCTTSGGGTGGTTVITVPDNTSINPTIEAGAEIDINMNLTKAIGEVLSDDHLDDDEKTVLKNISETVTRDTKVRRTLEFSGTRTELKTTIKYSGKKKVRNFMVFEKVPKSFAADASLVNVSAPGATVVVVEDDPSWLITYPEIGPEDEFSINYEVIGQKVAAIIDEVKTEFYAQVLEDDVEVPEKICTPSDRSCMNGKLYECEGDGSGWSLLKRCEDGCDAKKNACTGEEKPGVDKKVFDNITIVAMAVISLLVVSASYLIVMESKKRKPEKHKSVIEGAKKTDSAAGTEKGEKSKKDGIKKSKK